MFRKHPPSQKHRIRPLVLTAVAHLTGVGPLHGSTHPDLSHWFRDRHPGRQQVTLRSPRPTDREAAARVLSCSCEGKLATVWVGRRHARHVGGLRGGEAEEGGRVATPLSSHLRAPPTLPPGHTSHLPPGDGVESGAGGVGHRPGGTEQGRAVGESREDTFQLGGHLLRLDLARCLLLLLLEKTQN